MPYKLKQIKVKIKRKESTVRKLKQALKEQECAKWKQSQKERREDASGRNVERELKRKLKQKDNDIRALDDDKAKLEEQIQRERQHNEKKKQAGKRDKKTYATQTRMIVYDCLMARVPTQHIHSLIHSISKRTGVNLEPIPQRSAIEQMQRELGIITELQTAETAVNTKNITIGFDATTQEGVHVNAVHLTTAKKPNEKEDKTTPKTCQVISLDQLAGGTANDYAEHIVSSIDSLARVHSDFHKEEFHETRKKIIANIANTMTDRATVNHCTIEKLKGAWGKPLNELNCHLHPLDTVASTCRSALKNLESEKGALFGKDCTSANIICQLSKLRYRDGKGDPRGFLLFLERNELPRSLFPRYQGNRLHILFHTAGVVVQYRNLLLNGFLTPGTVSCGGLKTGLRRDLKSETGMKLELCVLGLVGKLLTGPWMKKFYVSADAQLDQVSSADGM
ncbi:uncharacterized protein, partial [Littorina saxatilis]|uniref:uncharacterized protein n=1 Tax=Littorina saxatilis TaxID=31220 RepID=UPI0038B5C83E